MSKEKDQPAANVAFVGVHDDGKKKDVPAYLQVTRKKIIIPKVAHSEGFYSADAALLINSSSDFKAFVAKGDK